MSPWGVLVVVASLLVLPGGHRSGVAGYFQILRR